MTAVTNALTWYRCKLWRERERERESTGIQTQGLLTTSWTLLELSHWTHGRGAEASLLITAMLEASADSSCLSLSLSWIHCISYVLTWLTAFSLQMCKLCSRRLETSVVRDCSEFSSESAQEETNNTITRVPHPLKIIPSYHEGFFFSIGKLAYTKLVLLTIHTIHFSR